MSEDDAPESEQGHGGSPRSARENAEHYARLADALGEALYEWKELLDAYVENRPPPDERPEIAIHDTKIIDRLRAVLAEVERG